MARMPRTLLGEPRTACQWGLPWLMGRTRKNRNVPFHGAKKNACRPFRSCTRLSSKKSHEGGGEHSADDPDKAIAVPTRNVQETSGRAANHAPDGPSGK